MRDFINKYKFLIIAILLIAALVGFRAIREYRASKVKYQSKQNEEYEPIPKTIGVNEYINVNMSNDTIVKMYFSDFKAYVIGDIEASYKLLDEDYRNKKFPNIEMYKTFMSSYKIENARIVKYSTAIKDGNRIYIMYDNNNNYYAFKVTGVLEYTVYLDDFTVEIR